METTSAGVSMRPSSRAAQMSPVARATRKNGMTKMRWRDSGAAAEPNRASISSAAGVSTTAPTRMALRGRVRASR